LLKNKKFVLFLPLILLIIFVHSVLKERLYQTFQIYGGGERLEHLSASCELFVKKPVLGWGPNTFKKLYPGEHSHCHNLYLELLYSSGFFCLLMFLLIVLATFKFGFKIYSKKKDPVLIGLMSSIIVILSHGLLDSTLYSQTGFMFWFLAGSIFVYEDKV